MTINNQKYTIQLRLRKFAVILSLAILIVIIALSRILTEPFLGLTRVEWPWVIAGCIVLYYLVEYWLDNNYIWYTDEGTKIKLRYYSLRPLSQAKVSIEIPRNELVKYELRHGAGGIKTSLVLHQSTPAGVATYKPLSLTALKKEEIHALEKSLQNIIQSHSK